MNKFMNNLKRQAEENPMLAIAVTVTDITVMTKLMDANTAHKNSKAWAMEVQRRAMKTK